MAKWLKLKDMTFNEIIQAQQDKCVGSQIFVEARRVDNIAENVTDY